MQVALHSDQRPQWKMENNLKVHGEIERFIIGVYILWIETTHEKEKYQGKFLSKKQNCWIIMEWR